MHAARSNPRPFRYNDHLQLNNAIQIAKQSPKMGDTTTQRPKWEFLHVIGDIRIEPAATPVPSESMRYLVMGPTGAGKSSFIEALAAKSQNLSISKDQLAGFTQKVSAYHLVNITSNGLPVYLIDTPGFSDGKISEIEIIHMVSNWLMDSDNTISSVDKVFFFIPITETRLGGSRRKTIEMLRTLLRHSEDLDAIIFVTTMWDTLSNDRSRQRAESNFTQLRDEILKEFIDGGAKIVRFHNSKASALQMLDMNVLYMNSFLVDVSPAAPHLYRDLHGRIESGLQQRKTIEMELAQPESEDNLELKSLLEKNYTDNEETLMKFIQQFIEIGDPPAGFEKAYQYLRKAIDDVQGERMFQTPILMKYGGTTVFNVCDDLCFDLMEKREAVELICESVDTDVAPDVGSTAIVEQTHIFHNVPLSPGRIRNDCHLQPTRLRILKGLIRRLIRAAKRRGTRWFTKSKD